MLKPEILIIASEDNKHAQAVCKYLEEKASKITAYILNTSLLPVDASWVIHMSTDDFHILVATEAEEKDISLANLRSIWWLQPGIPKIDPKIKNKHEANFAYTECCQALEGMWYAIDCLWVNQPERQEIALNPIYQFQAAKISGFKIPDTLITSHPSSFMAFWQKHNENISYRPLLPLLGATQERFEKENLRDVENIKFAPCLFQESPYLKQHLSVLMIGSFLLATEVHYGPDDQLIFQKCEIPVEIANKIKGLGKITGLIYTSVDLVLDHQNNYIFFGMDPYSPFLPVQEQTQVPLTETLAQLLLAGKTGNAQCHWPTLSWKDKKEFSPPKTNP